MDVLVSDTSVLIDLERGNLLEECFQLPYRFVVPDLLYDRELAGYNGAALQQIGLEVVASSEDVSVLATNYSRDVKALSAPDAFALALAKSHTWILLSGDGALRQLALTEAVTCHGVLWALDAIHSEGLASATMLDAGLSEIGAHPRCRLPRNEIKSRLALYRE